MEQNEIIEGNRIIAEFMGWVHHEDKAYDDYEMSQLRYHNSWDKLMPVVEKINTLAIDNVGEVGVYIKPFACYVAEDEHHPITMSTVANHPVLIEIVWITIVTFIRWYNTIPKPTP